MKTRAKLQLQEVHELYLSKDSKRYVFLAVCDDGTPENEKFARFTPNGRFEMICNNPVVHEQLAIGKTYYFDITEA